MRTGFVAEEGCDAFSQTDGGMCRIDSVVWLEDFPAPAPRVIPAEAGIQKPVHRGCAHGRPAPLLTDIAQCLWIPAFAGMTLRMKAPFEGPF